MLEEVLLTQRALGVVLHKQTFRGQDAKKKEEEAERMLEDTVKGMERLLGTKDKETLSTTVQLAEMLLEGESIDKPKATNLLKRAVPRLKAIVHAASPDLNKAEKLLKKSMQGNTG